MEKPFAPTERRLRRARARGDVPVSPAVARAAGLAGFAVLAPPAVRATASAFSLGLRAALAHPERATAPSLTASVLTLALPIGSAIAAGALVSGLIQAGGAAPWERLSRGASGESGEHRPWLEPGRLGSAVVAAATGAAVLAVSVWALASAGPSLARSLDAPGTPARFAGDTLRHALLAATAVLVAGAALQYVVVRRGWLLRLRMTAAEVADERREGEGDPEMKRAGRRAHENAVAGERAPPR